MKLNFDEQNKLTEDSKYDSLAGEKDNFLFKVLYTSIVSSGSSGGRKFRYNCTVIAGDRRGNLGISLGKSNNIRQSIINGKLKAKKAAKFFNAGNRFTIPFEVTGEFKTTKVLLKPSKNGIIAGMVVRSIIELLGIQNISSKVFGSHHRRSVAFATIDAIQKIDDLNLIFQQRKKQKELIENNNIKG